MKILVDTCTFLWIASDSPRLSKTAAAVFLDLNNERYLSAASAWEITTKHRLGKLPGVAAIIDDLDAAIVNQSFIGLPISIRHGQVAGALPGPHRDPVDRMLIAQAMVDGLVLVSNEQIFDAYGVGRLW